MGKMFKGLAPGVWITQRGIFFEDADKHGLTVVVGAIVQQIRGEFLATVSPAQRAPFDPGSARTIGIFDTERKAMYAARKAALKALADFKNQDA